VAADLDRQPKSFVLYDGECPICASYMALLELRRFHPHIEILDARRHPTLVARLRAQGFEVNESLLVKLGATVYAGADATALLSDLSSEQGWVRRLSVWAIGGAPWSRILYPYLRGTRNLLLRILGRPLIG
jgi:predicted DCC family thiol-disulfide oxidoreductase YuxK